MNGGKDINKFSVIFSIVVSVICIWLFATMDMLWGGVLIAIVVIPFGNFLGKFMASPYKLPESLKNKDVLFHANNVRHEDGLKGIGPIDCTICIREEDVLIKAGKVEFLLDYSKILGANYSTDYKTVQDYSTITKNKGTAGKALVGGALMGATGAIIGASTGSKSTSETKAYDRVVADKSYLSITYYNSENNIATIVFSGGLMFELKELEMEINKRIGVLDNAVEEVIKL